MPSNQRRPTDGFGAGVRLNSDSLIVVDDSDNAFQSSPSVLATAAARRVPSVAATAAQDDHADDVQAMSELQRQQTDSLVYQQSQQILDLTAGHRSSAAASIATSVTTTASVTTNASDPVSPRRASDVTVGAREVRSYDRRHRAKMQQTGANNAGGHSASGGRKLTDADVKRRAAAAIVSPRPTAHSPLRSPQVLSNQHDDGATVASNATNAAAPGVPPMSEDYADGVNAKIAMYSNNPAPTESKQRKEKEDLKAAGSDSDEENLFTTNPSVRTMSSKESHRDSDASSVQPLARSARVERIGPASVASEGMESRTSQASNANPNQPQLSIANAVATDDLEDQIRRDIIGDAVQATQVMTIREDEPLNADVAVVNEADADGDSNDNNSNRKKKKKEEEDDDTSSGGDGLLSRTTLLYLLICCVCLVIAIIVAAVFVLTGSADSGSSSSSNGDTGNGDNAGGERTSPPTDSDGVAGPTEAPQELESHHFKFLDWLKLEMATVNPGALDDTSSPQYQAFEWLALTRISSEDDIPVNAGPAKAKARERYALACIYYSTEGDTSWTTSTGWLTSAGFCTWHGITCDGDGLVNNFDISDNNLKGTIPPEIGVLTRIASLKVSKNPFESGRTSFGGGNKRVRLRQRDLQVGDSSAEVGLPTTIGLLTNMQELRTSFSGIAGTIPTEIGNCTRLSKIYFKDSYLVGTLPSELGRLVELDELDVPKNSLVGQLPDELGGLQEIRKVDLSDNGFIGTIPETYTTWPSSMSWIKLDGNPLQSGAVEDTFCTIRNPASELEYVCGAECTCCTDCN